MSELPRPPATTGLNILGIIGPGAILLGLSLGSGEWLLGPAAFVRYGLPLLWVTTVAVLLQTVLNTELIRYTLYTGESALTGFMRTRPGSTFWSSVYALLYFLQVGWPAWAGTSAGAIFYLFVGRLAGPGDAEFVHLIGAGTFLLCVFTLLIGQRIERTLEIFNWILIIFILGGLLVLCLIYAAPGKWLDALAGYIGFNTGSGSFDFFPVGADWFLISAFAAYSGAGGVVNLMLSNWARDKGYGMARAGGYISAAIGGRKVKLAHVGSIFKITPDSLTRWRGWWRIISIDQWLLFGVGALLAMGLPAILYTSFIEPGRDIRGLAVAAELSNAMATRGSAVLPFLVALMGAWVLFKTQLDIVDGQVRAITDILWTGSRRARAWRGGDVRYVYYTILAVVVIWGLIALRVTQPIVLLQLGANVAGIVFVISALHILYLNTHFLPKELQPPVWRRVALVMLAVFYGSFVYLWLMGGVTPDPAKGFLFNIPRYLFGG
ncbi:MAG: Nramp family divalent metal transporter [Chloroflexi bacterium]|nr:Nramp family divalent metal transporter [Chloroflexota bacterium]